MKANFSLWDVRPWGWLFLLIFSCFLIITLGAYYDIAAADPAAASNPIIKIFGREFLIANQLSLYSLMVVIFLLDIFFLVKGFSALINHSSISNAINETFSIIPVECMDEDIIAKASKLKIAVTPDRVYLPKEIIIKASPEALANIMCWLFYLRLAEINDDARRRPHTAFHSLADHLLNVWTYPKIIKFLEAVNRQKKYIGKQMEAAFDRRELERKVESLLIKIDEVKAREHDYMANDVDESVDECKTLLSGKSAMANWFVKKCLRLFKKT